MADKKADGSVGNANTAGSATPQSDLFYGRAFLGIYLRQVREQAGLSLREMEALTGISNSEVFKVESGSQECRLESFVRICAALGVPCGEIIDQAVIANPVAYEAKISGAPEIQKWLDSADLIREAITINFAVLAAFTAHLVRSSRPLAVAKGTEYPNELTRNVFLEMAGTLENITRPADRRELLNSLRENPLGTLSTLKLLKPEFITPYLRSVFDNESTDKSLRGFVFDALKIPPRIPVWFPFYPRDAAQEREKQLTAVAASGNSADVKPKLPTLLQRLNKAVEPSGKASELAKFLGVDLPSVSRWLSGKREPGGEVTLKLLHWVEQQERK